MDLRGMMTDEAIGALDLFLDNAVLGKLNEVRIIHGKGTGAVRKAVREHLKRSRRCGSTSSAAGISSPSARAATARARMA